MLIIPTEKVLKYFVKVKTEFRVGDKIMQIKKRLFYNLGICKKATRKEWVCSTEKSDMLLT